MSNCVVASRTGQSTVLDRQEGLRGRRGSGHRLGSGGRPAASGTLRGGDLHRMSSSRRQVQRRARKAAECDPQGEGGMGSSATRLALGRS